MLSFSSYCRRYGQASKLGGPSKCHPAMEHGSTQASSQTASQPDRQHQNNSPTCHPARMPSDSVSRSRLLGASWPPCPTDWRDDDARRPNTPTPLHKFRCRAASHSVPSSLSAYVVVVVVVVVVPRVCMMMDAPFADSAEWGTRASPPLALPTWATEGPPPQPARAFRRAGLSPR